MLLPSCLLCPPDRGPVIGHAEHWTVILHHNQSLLGKLMPVLRRHAEEVTALSEPEWAKLHAQTEQATAPLHSLFAPDHFNYARRLGPGLPVPDGESCENALNVRFRLHSVLAAPLNGRHSPCPASF